MIQVAGSQRKRKRNAQEQNPGQAVAVIVAIPTAIFPSVVNQRRNTDSDQNHEADLQIDTAAENVPQTGRGGQGQEAGQGDQNYMIEAEGQDHMKEVDTLVETGGQGLTAATGLTAGGDHHLGTEVEGHNPIPHPEIHRESLHRTKRKGSK